MRIGLAQINCTLGDFSGNRLKILEYTQRALDKKCDLVIFPELTLFGYIPQDLLERPSIVDDQLREFARLQKELPDGIAILVGLVTRSSAKIGKPYYNSAVLLVKGKKPKFFHKELLPTYDVFDEARHMQHGQIARNEFKFKGHKILLTICEDIWGWALSEHPSNYLANPLVALKKNKYDLVLNMSASPFTNQKVRDRETVVKRTAELFKTPMVYVNMVGAQDEIIFDGGSFAVDKRGKKLAQSIYFAEDLNVLDLESGVGGFRPQTKNQTELLRQALVLGIRDFVHKTGFQRVHLGLSGGIDSAVVACLAVDALGPSRVTVLTLPGPYSSPASRKLAEQMAKNAGIRCLNFDIDPAYEVLVSSLQKTLGELEFGIVHENLQSRLRGMFLMALANKESSLLLTTGNKSEYATGYSTMYGDMCGGLAPIADLLKRDVYALARLYNEQDEVIPDEIITRAPSAELRPNQKDQDSLPPYDELDSAVQRLVEQQKPARTPTEKWLLGVLMKTEFKRWQSAPILKVSPHAFGRGRRMPIAHKARS
jgi:NAD+ synthase (glutamine-hydrolysing)